jgi:ABC-type antimicrobial peptide transport system permease subunit
MEVYNRRIKQIGKRKADIRFIGDVLLLFRPGILKPTGTISLNNGTMLKSYFTIGWRNILRNKSYSISNIVGLALSITCAIFIYALINYHLRYDNFHANSDRIYRIVTELHRDQIAYQSNVPSPLGNFIRNEHTFAEKVGRIYTEEDVLVTIRKGDDIVKFEEEDGVAFTEPEFFEIFNFPLTHGNKATVLVEPNTAIVTESKARQYFGDKNPVGETLWLRNKIAFTITGVLKDIPVNTEITSDIFVSFISLKTVDPGLYDDTRGWGGIRGGMKCFVLLNPGVTIPEVEERIAPYVKRFRPTSKNVHHYKLQPLSEVHFNPLYEGQMEKRNLWILAVVGLFLIVTACVNFINLATAQALKRSKEVGVRKVLGGLRGQLFRQFIFETGIITFFGIAFALIAVSVLYPSFNLMFDVRLSMNLFSNPDMLLFLFGLGVVVTLFAGCYPGLVLAGFKPVTALKGKLSHLSMSGFNTRRSLIISQFAISQVLIIGMIVIMNQLRFARQSDLGFVKDAMVMIPTGDYVSPTTNATLKNEIIRTPGVENVSLCYAAPAAENDWNNSIKFDDASEEVNFRTSIKAGDVDYLKIFDIDLVAGRNLSPSDTVREMLVNEALVRKLGLTPEDALGRFITANGGSMRAPIVGVMRDFHDKSFHEQINPVLVTTYSDDYANYAVKLNLADVKETLAVIEKAWLAQHPSELFHFEFLDESIAGFYKTEETMLSLIQIFSFIAIFIGCLGLYGLVCFMTAQKTKEVGIRKVLGGTIGHIIWIFGKELSTLIVLAFLVAAPVGWWVMDAWLQEFEYQIEISPWIFVLAVGSSLIIAALTVSYQVTKTALMNPSQSLRTE